MAGADPITIRTTLTGKGTYYQHNVQLADPDNYWAKQISKISAKRKKTEEDRQEMRRLEFLGGLYVHENQIVVPKMNVRRCFQEAAKATRKGKDITRALSLADPANPNARLLFDGQDKTPEELYAAGSYSDITMVTVRGRVPRCRPAFSPWGLVVDWILLPNLMDFEEFSEIARTSGMIEGLGDNRINGHGRFDVRIDRLGNSQL